MGGGGGPDRGAPSTHQALVHHRRELLVLHHAQAAEAAPGVEPRHALRAAGRWRPRVNNIFSVPGGASAGADGEGVDRTCIEEKNPPTALLLPPLLPARPFSIESASRDSSPEEPGEAKGAPGSSSSGAGADATGDRPLRDLKPSPPSITPRRRPSRRPWSFRLVVTFRQFLFGELLVDWSGKREQLLP